MGFIRMLLRLLFLYSCLLTIIGAVAVSFWLLSNPDEYPYNNIVVVFIWIAIWGGLLDLIFLFQDAKPVFKFKAKDVVWKEGNTKPGEIIDCILTQFGTRHYYVCWYDNCQTSVKDIDNRGKQRLIDTKSGPETEDELELYDGRWYLGKED